MCDEGGKKIAEIWEKSNSAHSVGSLNCTTYFPPNRFMPSKANMRMNRNSRKTRLIMDWTL